MKILMVIAGALLSVQVAASTRLVVPVYTTHIIERGQYDYNESNPGLGLEYRTAHYMVGAMHAVNSYEKPANYLYVAKPVLFKGLSLGLLAMTNQAITYNKAGEVAEFGTVVTPITAYEYKYFRISTSYPFAKLSAKQTDVEKADLVNVQLVYKF